ncbi:hypothetical protein [Blastochloris viridis]|uniref:Capsule polysaccharide biosynthesis protein n=1 Tax=Blastochloris viridis TaxID=1079 RepID=A0A0H5BGU0_BLAVI|nr:hypothetical protein [Blastochloris viridis]ALK09741.1 Capsule polysaccharide biosynthesis protein [Blastochloris viridis]BAS00365.1 hypothetical protein BV133_2771 [Blastochloris viridis]CUU42404.1 Capsule polysaccharide biosynthesis protein [Blastochloris viridis]
MSLDLRAFLRSSPKALGARLSRLNLLARTGLHQDLRPILATDAPGWQAARDRARTGPRVVIATNNGGQFGLSAIDRLLAVALTLRGASVHTVLCDRALPACMMCELNLQPDPARLAARGPSRLLCGYCHDPAATRQRQFGLAAERLGDFITPEDRRKAEQIAAGLDIDALRNWSWDGLPLGEHAYAGTLRYFARGTLDDEPHGLTVARRFLAAAVVTAAAYRRLFERLKPDVVVAHHGIYSPQGVVAAVARAHGIRVVTWNPAYRRHCFIFSHDDTYHHTLMSEPTGRWAQTPLSEAQRSRIIDYLVSRREGREDWIRFHKDPDYATRARLAEFGLEPDKPLVVAFTNVFWDAQLHYPTNAFASQIDWLVATIAFFAGRPDLQLVIRVHPAEVSGSPASRQRAADEIARRVPDLPANVAIVPPESPLSSYQLADLANAVLIYATKMGVELTAMGIPVVAAGEAWVRNKGITEDVTSPEHYQAILNRLPFERVDDPDRRERALRYAHHFFFRRMIPLVFVMPEHGPRRFTISARDLSVLRPGGDPGLDTICSGILEGSPFEA